MRLIIETRGEVHDLPYERTALSVFVNPAGQALLYCREQEQTPLFVFDSLDDAVEELLKMARLSQSGESYHCISNARTR